MTPGATAIAPDIDESVFDASAYDLNIPTHDGFKAVTLDIRFSGAGSLDRTSEDDLALLEAARLGREIRLIVVGEVGAKGFRLNRNAENEGQLGYTCTVKVISVEAGEIA
jgi:hypothetical protein